MTDNKMTTIRRLSSVLWDAFCIVLSAKIIEYSLGRIFVTENSSTQQKIDELFQSINHFPSTLFFIGLVAAIFCLIGAMAHIIFFLSKRTQLAKKFRPLQNWGAAIVVFSQFAYIVLFIFTFGSYPS
jgi:hypothetical protein